MAACTYPNNFVANPTTTEARACLQAVAVAEELGFRRLVVEGDSLTVVKKFSRLAVEEKWWSSQRVWIEEAPPRVEKEAERDGRNLRWES